jgi:putative NADH-flavin reductase
MRILLLGATGRTGQLVLEQALERGHIVHALVRDKQKISFQKYNLLLFEGTPSDKIALEKSIAGCEAVISVLNISRKNEFPWAGLRTPKDFLSATMKNIIEVAGKNNIHRVVFTSAWGVNETKNDLPSWFRWLIDHSSLRHPYRDHERQEELIKESGMEWTAVRPVFLTNSKKKKNIIVHDNNSDPHLFIGRKNLAGFMLDVVGKNLYRRESPVVSEE